MPRRDLFHLLCSHLLHAQDRIYCCLREGDCLACFPFPLFWQIIPEEYYHLITPLVSSLEVQVQDASRVFFWSGLFSAYRQALFQPRPHLAFYSVEREGEREGEREISDVSFSSYKNRLGPHPYDLI